MRWTVAGVVAVIGLLAFTADDAAHPRAADALPDGAPPARVPLDVARDRARLMHELYEETLHVMHVRYFHGDRVTVPARALEDVFSAMTRRSRGQARWISVNTKPMSIDHEPETPFEKQAALQIAAGKTEIEEVEKGFYRRAAAIPLTAGCVGCHVGFSADAGKTPRFAGLVISIPIEGE
jgi:hypothetical protein